MFVYLGIYWRTAASALISLLLVNAANLYPPQLLRQLIDKGITPLSLQFVWGVAGVLVALAAVRDLFNLLQRYLGEVTSRGVAYDLLCH